MIRWGINALNHGSSIAVFKDKNLVYFESCKNDRLDQNLIDTALSFGQPEHVYWYERPFIKRLRQLRAGQWSRVFDLSVSPKKYLKSIGIIGVTITYTPHHASHAAAGFYTSPFNRCGVLVLDAIGEFESSSIWVGDGNRLTKVWAESYPNSLGLFYSAFTHLCGFVPVLEEGKFQQSAKNGNPDRYYSAVKKYINSDLKLTVNLHKGVRDWPYDINSDQDKWDIAAAVQLVFTEQLDFIIAKTKDLSCSKNLVYMGGCAFNSDANKSVIDLQFDGIWSMPNPGDASSAIGAVLYHTKHKISWDKDLAKHIEIKV